MRALRMLTATGVVVSLLAAPAISVAQDPEFGAPEAPLALRPDDRLPLRGTPWRLEAYHHRDRQGTPGPEVAAFLGFDASTFEGSGGCTRVRGQYGAVGSALEIKLRSPDGRTCGEQITLVQDAVEAGLRKAASYEIVAGPTPAEDKLVIRSAGGEEVLRYGLDDVAELEQAEWRLASYTSGGESIAASSEMPAVMTFTPTAGAYYKRRQSGRASGSTGCNGIVADFSRQGDVLSLSQLERTDAPCTPRLAAQEEAIVAVLDSTSISLDLPYDRLLLTALDTGQRLEFISQTPLEGSTWIAEDPFGGQSTDARVTLRLEEGIASGEGPCGSYEAGYATDGVFITFRDVQGARDDACSELKAEKALLDALRGAVTITRTPDRLDLLDARGVTVLSFGRPFAP